MTTLNKAVLRGHLALQLGEFQLDTGEFSLPLEGVTVVFGRSGSGKSTFLRTISGLEHNAQGELFYAEQAWQTASQFRAVLQRDIGFVFQDAALFPHLSVEQNLRYAWKRRARDAKGFAFDEVVQRLGITQLLTRMTEHLSGGERQRVAIARALLSGPKLLCMDEPLSALDWQAKSELLSLIKEVVLTYQVPVLYITHSPAEVEKLADTVVFMEQGRIRQIEPLAVAMSRADSPLFVEEGVVSLLRGEPQAIENGLCPISMGKQTLWVSEPTHELNASVRIRVLAKDVSLALSDPQQLSIVNHLKATIVELVPEAGHRMLVKLSLEDGQQLFAEITQHSSARLQLSAGMSVFALIKSVVLAD